jgi:hypothetical protein
MSTRSLISISALAGLAIGVLTWVADNQYNAVNHLGSTTALWVFLAFGIGNLSRNLPSGAVASAETLTIGVIAYYACMRLFAGGANPSYLLNVASLWFVLAPFAGAIFGIAGSVAGRQRFSHTIRGISIGMPSGVIIGESAFFLWTMYAPTSGEILIRLGIAVLGAALPVLFSVGKVRLIAYGFVVAFGIAGFAMFPLIRVVFGLLNPP